MWNTWRVLLVAFFVVVSPNLTPAATAADQAVFNVIHGADPTLVNRKVLYRNAVAPDLDLVIAIGSPAEWPLDPDSPAIWWDEKRKLGLFLQERARPDRVYSLALAAGSLDCGARIERATSTDTVISCTGEKAYQGLNQKFVYDIRAKALVSHFAYQPFAMMRVLNVSGRTVFVGSDLKRLVAVEFQPGGSPEFRILGNAEAAQWLGRVKTAQEWIGPGRNQILYVAPDDPAPIRFGPSGAFTFARGSIVDSHGKEYNLRQSTYDDFARARAPACNGQLRSREYDYRGSHWSSAVRRGQDSGSAKRSTTVKETPVWAASATLTRPIVSITFSFRPRSPITPFRRFASNPMRCGWASFSRANMAVRPRGYFVMTERPRLYVSTNCRTRCTASRYRETARWRLRVRESP